MTLRGLHEEVGPLGVIPDRVSAVLHHAGGAFVGTGLDHYVRVRLVLAKETPDAIWKSLNFKGMFFCVYC